ncbi:MAG: Uma2 family endonuclease [Pseudanabaena sp. ELA607]
MTIAPSPPVAATDVSYTVAEYFDLELPADTRHEYRHGKIIPMTGGTPAHNEIISNLIVLLKLALKKQPYGVFASDQRLWIPERQIYTYPDVMVIARPLELQAGRKDTVTNPVLIAEVLSPSTAAYDRGEKFASYRTIPTLKEYLLIDQERPHLEQYVKQSDHAWLFTEYDGLDAQVPLAAVAGKLAFVDLYENLYDGNQ